jgi:hypothetical protein
VRDNILRLPTVAWWLHPPIFPLCCFRLSGGDSTRTGAIARLTTILLASIGLILAGPTVTGIDSPKTNHHLIHARPYPLHNPGILSVLDPDAKKEVLD